MSFLSSLFGYSDRPAQGSKLAYIPEELKPYVTEILKDTQELYKQRMKEGYTPYTGDTIAGLTPEEIASQEGLKSLVGTQRPFQEESLGLLRGGSEQFTADTAKKYMSPYMRAVIDTEKEQAQRQYERTQRPEFEKAAVDAGGMSGLGTRAAVEAAERETGQQRLLADIETRGQQKAYQDAQQAFEDQKRRERALAGDISTTGQNIFSAGLAEQGLLKGIGEEKRELAQSGLDEAYMKYMEQKQFPEQQLARYMSSIYGNPVLSQPNYRTTGTPAQASKAKSLVGLGLAGIKGLGGGSYSEGFKSLFGASGGQVGGLNTLYRQTGGDIEIIDETEFQTDVNRPAEDFIQAKNIAVPASSPDVQGPDILEEISKRKEVERVANLSPSQRSMEEYVKDPYKDIMVSREVRDERTRNEAKIRMDALKDRKVSNERFFKTALAGWLEPHGTIAYGVSNALKAEGEFDKRLDKLKDAEVIKTADEYVENLRKTYPETIGKQITDRYLEIKKAGGSRKVQAAKIRKMISEGVLNFAKADKEGRGDPLKLLTKKQIEKNTIWGDSFDFIEKGKDKILSKKLENLKDNYKYSKSQIIEAARILERKNPTASKEVLIKAAIEAYARKEGIK